MRILFVTTGYPPEDLGGTAVHVRQLARAMKRRGHEVAVFCRIADPRRADYDLEESDGDGIPATRVNYNFRDADDLDSIFENRRIEDLFAGAVQRWKPDLVHVHHLTCLSTTILDRAKALGLPLALTLHDFWFVCPKGQRIRAELDICRDLDRERCSPCLKSLWPRFDITPAKLARLDERILKRLRACDVLIAPSEHHRSRMLEIPLDPSKVVAVPHGLDFDLLPGTPVRRFPPGRIGFIGSVLPSKGVHILIEAMNLLGNPALECHIYGEALPFHGDREYGARLRALARPDLPFHFHGKYSQEDLPRILAGLDILVAPSLWWESFCLTIREAMLMGLPAVASDLGAMGEAYRTLAPRQLFAPGDPRDLARALTELATDFDAYRAACNLRGAVRTLDAMASDTEALYMRIAARDSAPAADPGLVLRKRKGSGRPYATVFVPCYNGGPLWERVLDRILSQRTDFDYEVLVIDSGSRDGSDRVAESRSGVRVIRIPNSEFNHGLTRNRGVQEARGEIVALLTQDAEPLDEGWLQRLVDNFDDPEVAGAYCHQIPRPDCNPFQRDRLSGWTAGEGEPVRKRLDDPGEWDAMHPYERYRLIAFDDVASCVRKSAMQQIPFEKRQFGEDVAWAKSAILAGRTLVMDPRSVVVHSHNNSAFYEFKRVYLDHQNLRRLVGLHTVPTLRHVAQCTVKATFHLLGAVWRDDRGWLYRLAWSLKTPLYAFGQNLGQYLGARSAIRGTERGFHAWLDRRLRRGV